ncbi:kinase-like domain-containing protein [Lasiosphaeria hispida]|uniref:Kinase-like domain-containing protein n=1 Tax=Lasiosphaeria hispida TaxID=260671 RepID=A0AAJ0M8X6_9PEZI|nr:kinase-like domain-containing protein [Lasiosphaeria hispida]
MENGFKDSWLSAEVCSPPKCLTKETLTQLDSKLWGRGRAVRICETQWKFIVPVLSTERVNYDFEEEAILPFTNMQTVDGGAFSKVHQVRIQEGHFIDPSRPVNWPSLFAVKQIVPPDSVERQRIADSWANEAQTLRRMNVVHSEHIVRFITAFTRLDIGSERSHYLVFEWAEGGNLENLFTQCQNPTLSANLVKQTVRQLSGLAEALRATHELGIRHGDIKPSNVLRFGASEGDILGTLKIGDWGLAKSHPDATVLRSRRGVATDTRFGTVLYEPPEVELGQLKLMSRLYDIWSMGCLILEIIVWLVHGYEGVRNLRSDIQGSYRERVPYYVVDEVSDGKLKGKLQDAVEKWMDYMAEEPAFDRDTALGQLLVLVRRRLLVVELPPEMGNTVYAKNWEPDSLDSRAGKNPAFSLRPPTPAGEKSEKSGSPRQYRATSAELVAALGLGGIMDASDRPRYYWLNTSAGLRQAPRFYRNANLKALQDSSGMLTPQDLRPLSINSPTIVRSILNSTQFRI